MPKSSLERYQEFQEYTNYIDTSDVMLGFYKNEEGSRLEKYYLMIEEWLLMEPEDPTNNYPLVIEGDGGVGKKTLLVKWYEYHQSIKPQNKKDLMILHFATTGGNNSNYYYAIYRILIQLREQLNIGQKVELHQQKIRKYFSYWLDVCDQKIQNESFQCTDTIYEKIVLVFEGIDYLLDRGTGREGNIAFWLPKYFPKNVKVIVTADGESESMRYFDKLGCQKVLIPSDSSLVRNMIEWQNNKQLCVSGDIKDKLFRSLKEISAVSDIAGLYVKSYLSCLMPEKIKEFQLKPASLQFLQNQLEKLDLSQLQKMTSTEQLFDFLLDFWGHRLLKSHELFKQLVGILIHTQKGLNRSEIVSITNISQEELKLFITLFRTFLMNFKDLWMIKNDCFKKVINLKYSFSVVSLSEKIADSLKKTPNSVRKLEEETFHLYTAGNHFKLKEVISDIQNFLLLFNPYTKYDLCKYWQKLEEKSFDPVIEYNKAIEGFEMHYHPTSDDLFRIITQISRFLREFSDFETCYTPQFRHPKIVGMATQLNDIGILGQFKNLDMCQQGETDSSVQEQRQRQLFEQQGEGSNQNQEELKLKKKIKEMYEKVKQGKHIKKINKVELEPKVDKCPQKKKKDPLSTSVHHLNIEVKTNQDNFRKHYFDQIKPFLQKISLSDGKNQASSDNQESEDYWEDSDREDIESENIVAKIQSIEREKEKQKSKHQQLSNLKILYAKTVEEEFELTQKPPTNYYYKRWIWMQFPWVCMAMKCDYSDKLRICFTSPTSYMSVSEEREFTLQALKIALEAKKKKQNILETSESAKPKKRKETTLGTLTETSRFQLKKLQNEDSGLVGKPKLKTKIEELGIVTNSFLSLRNLEKEMQQVNQYALLKQAQSQSKKQLNCQRRSPQQLKATLFLTEDEKVYQQEEPSSILCSINRRKKNKVLAEEDINVSCSNTFISTGTKAREGLLPRIKQNINKQMMSELQNLERNNVCMRKEMDGYLYRNKMLAKKLKELKIIQSNNNNQVKNEKKINQTKKKIEEYQNKIEKVKYEFAYLLLEHERLNVLIKICQENKTENEEAIPDLVFAYNNLKKMINLEKTEISELDKKMESIKKLTKKFLRNCYERVRNEATLTEEINNTFKNRDNFQEEVSKYDEMILDEIEDKRKELDEQAKSIQCEQQQLETSHSHKKEYGTASIHFPHNNSQMNNSQVFNTTGMNRHEEDSQNYREIYSRIMQYIDISDEQNYKNDPKYKALISGLSKQKELMASIESRKMDLEILERKNYEEKRLLETLMKAEQEDDFRQRQSSTEAENEGSEKENKLGNEELLQKTLHEKQRSINKLTETKLSCLGMLNTWYSQLGLPEQRDLVITQEFTDKIWEAKALLQI